MKKQFILFLLTLSISITSFANPNENRKTEAEKLRKQADELYKSRNNYIGALDLYQKSYAFSQEIEDLYNIGNCYYALNQLTDSVFVYDMYITSIESSNDLLWENKNTLGNLIQVLQIIETAQTNQLKVQDLLKRTFMLSKKAESLTLPVIEAPAPILDPDKLAVSDVDQTTKPSESIIPAPTSTPIRRPSNIALTEEIKPKKLWLPRIVSLSALTSGIIVGIVGSKFTITEYEKSTLPETNPQSESLSEPDVKIIILTLGSSAILTSFGVGFGSALFFSNRTPQKGIDKKSTASVVITPQGLSASIQFPFEQLNLSPGVRR
jgi:hypothetical protein